MEEQRNSDMERAEKEAPRGTIFLMIVFLMALVGMWGAVYLTLINR